MKSVALLAVVTIVGGQAQSSFGDTGDGGPTNGSVEIQNLQNEIGSAVSAPKVYMGQKSQDIDDGEGTFCEKERSYSYAWQGQVGKTAISFDQNQNLVMHVEFNNSTVDVSGFRKGGILCTWEGGSGRLNVQNIAIDMTADPLRPDANGNLMPQIALNGLTVQGVSFDQLDLTVPFFTIQNGSSPDLANQLVGQEFNDLVVPTVLQTVGAQLNGALSSKVTALIQTIKTQY